MSLTFKPFSQMTPEDYAAIGFMGGLEVHQQLLTERKLFCRCPAGRYSDKFDAEVLRHMRPTLSELGEYDGTALMEKKTRKNIYYRIHHDTVCTYEFDDTPPFMPDERALDIALEISLLCNLSTVGEMHIGRKQYLDGSIPTGFQRTAILGVSGWIPYRERRIGIRQLSIEEDSCREVSDIGHDRVFLTDRLGMPLIEVVTEPDMRTPQEVADVCQIIRLLCRSTGKVRTGYGATREDVNVSVRGGTRVEIKGVPQITRIPLLVYNEARRQCSLLAIRDELKKRGVTADSFRWTSHDVTGSIARTPYQPIREAVATGHRVKCAVLKGFAGLLTRTTQEHTTFAKDFADRIRVIACLTQLPNMVHSDTAAEMLTARDWKKIRRDTKADDGDALILVWGSAQDTQTACQEIAIRAQEATVGVPSDTRQAFKDGTNGFERVLPGAERMYPDTDLPPMVIEIGRLDRIRAQLPEPVWERQQRYRNMSLPSDLIDPLAVSPLAPLFDEAVTSLNVCPVFAAVLLVRQLKAWRRQRLPTDSLSHDEWRAMFAAFGEGALTREAVVDVLNCILIRRGGHESGPTDIASVVAELGCTPIEESVLHDRIKEAVSLTDVSRFSSNEGLHRHLMGRLMHELRRRVVGRELSAAVAAAIDIPIPGRSRKEVGT